MALGAYLGPYSYATSTPGKLTVETCTVDYKYRSSTSSSSRKRTKTKWCYGTFAATNGTKDLNAELRSDALYQRGHVIEAIKTGDTSYQQDHGWVGAIAVGCVWWFGALIPLAIGYFGMVTGFSSSRAPSQGLLRTSLTLVGVGVIGLIVSVLVAFFV
jgi:VIT1/CCC1 family predicted Fe2+/Mn2+ transporter